MSVTRKEFQFQEIFILILGSKKHMDKNVEKVITQLRDREEQGLLKYGVNTERSDLSTLEWLQHLQEELMDATVYIEKLKNEMKETRVVMGVCFGERDDTTEGDWENEGGVTLPDVDDNSPREELDNWKKRYKGYREWKKKIPMKDLARLEEEYNE